MISYTSVNIHMHIYLYIDTNVMSYLGDRTPSRKGPRPRHSARGIAMAVLLVGPADDGFPGSRGTARKKRWSTTRTSRYHFTG